MIDTIVLTLTNDSFTIADPNKFTPPARWINGIHEFSGVPSKQNPQKREMRSGIYKPYLTLSPRPTSPGTIEPMLKIELSLPKFFYGNNFDELQYKDFKPLIAKLQKVLCEMGVQTTIENLAQASVSAIHYSKNIPLTDGSTPYHYIQKIREAHVKWALDVNMRDYRNEGHCFKWHCNAYEVLFYDKIKDLEKAKQSSKRATEKDSTLQLNLLDAFKKRKKFEVLRMEVRLNKRQKIKQLFNALNINTDLTFKKLFKPALSKKVLLHYLDEIANQRTVLLDYKKFSLESLIAALITSNPRLSLSRLFRLLGLKFALDLTTWRELQNMIPRYGSRSWYYLKADIKNVTLPSVDHSFGFLRHSLLQFSNMNILTFIEETHEQSKSKRTKRI